MKAEDGSTPLQPGPIGIFDSGYGGLTVFKEIARELPQYDYIYLGDNARAPYGPRSFEVVYDYTLECVQHLFDLGCKLIILACNTASAKALRNIQQLNLPHIHPAYRVLGVIRPTAERIGEFTRSRQVGVLATRGTVVSQSYVIEIEKLFPDIRVYQEACPMWVPLIENNEHLGPGADYFVQKYLDALMAQSAGIDTIVLGCTHYPLMASKILPLLPEGVQLLTQGAIVASSLADYLQRHPEMEALCSKQGNIDFYTTETPADFNDKAGIFFERPVLSRHLALL